MNEQHTIRAYSYTEWGDYKIMWRPDLMAGFYKKELEISGEPQFLYEVSFPLPFCADVSFHGVWENFSITTDRMSFMKARRLRAGALVVYVRVEFLQCEENPVFRILLYEGVDGVVFKKIKITEPPV